MSGPLKPGDPGYVPPAKAKVPSSTRTAKPAPAPAPAPTTPTPTTPAPTPTPKPADPTIPTADDLTKAAERFEKTVNAALEGLKKTTEKYEKVGVDLALKLAAVAGNPSVKEGPLKALTGAGAKKAFASALAKGTARKAFSALAFKEIGGETLKQFDNLITSIQNVSISGIPLSVELSKIPGEIQNITDGFDELTEGAARTPAELNIRSTELLNTLTKMYKNTGEFKVLFNSLTEDEVKGFNSEIGGSLAILEKIGGEALTGEGGKDFLNSLSLATMGSEKLGDTLKGVTATAVQLTKEFNIPFRRAIEMTISNFKDMEVFGKRAVSATLKTTQFETATGIKVADAFKRPILLMQEAADIAAKLNRVIGANVVSGQVLEELDPAERQAYLLEKIREANQQGLIKAAGPTGRLDPEGDPRQFSMVADVLQRTLPGVFATLSDSTIFLKRAVAPEEQFKKMMDAARKDLDPDARTTVMKDLAKVLKTRLEAPPGKEGESVFNRGFQLFQAALQEKIIAAGGERLATFPAEINKMVLDLIKPDSQLGRIIGIAPGVLKNQAFASKTLTQLSNLFKQGDGTFNIEGLSQAVIAAGIKPERIGELFEEALDIPQPDLDRLKEALGFEKDDPKDKAPPEPTPAEAAATAAANAMSTAAGALAAAIGPDGIGIQTAVYNGCYKGITEGSKV